MMKRIYRVWKRRQYAAGFFVVFGIVSVVYFTTQVTTIYGGDAGDLASAILTKGIAHPPGYPLFTLLGVDILSLLHIGTPAWRIAFLSSVPSVITFLFLYDLLYRHTKIVLLSVLGALFPSFLYPLWLYGVVVEVFALNTMFSMVLVWMSYRFFQSEKIQYLYGVSFLYGLSLTHHHIILFLLPALLYPILVKWKKLKFPQIFFSLLFGLLGILPYAYVWISSSSNPEVNWMGTARISNFLDLVTRAGYGTFRAGSFAAHHPILRLLDIHAFLNFVYTDFSLGGVLLIGTGFYELWKNYHHLFRMIAIGCVSYIFFLFYASFPLLDNFLLGTYERFVQPLYLLLSICVPFGILRVVKGLEYIIRRYTSYSTHTLRYIIVCMFIVLPVGGFVRNYSKISIVKNDQTAENLARDILNSTPKNSILMVMTDTPLFNTQYVYYAERSRPDVILIHYTKLFTPYYRYTLKKYYPELIVPEEENPLLFMEKFIVNNYKKYPILSKSSFSMREGTWIPQGLIFRYYAPHDIPQDKDIYAHTESLWSIYQNPLAGSLGIYKNLMLSDVLRAYTVAHQETAYWQMRHGYLDESISHLSKAITLFKEDTDNYILLSQALMQKNQCTEAEQHIRLLISLEPQELRGYRLLIANAEQCFKDQEKVKAFTKELSDVEKQKGTPLRSL